MISVFSVNHLIKKKKKNKLKSHMKTQMTYLLNHSEKTYTISKYIYYITICIIY